MWHLGGFLALELPGEVLGCPGRHARKDSDNDGSDRPPGSSGFSETRAQRPYGKAMSGLVGEHMRTARGLPEICGQD